MKRMETRKQSRRVIRALMYGLALASSMENGPDKAEEKEMARRIYHRVLVMVQCSPSSII